MLKLSRITRLLPQHSQKCLDRVGGRIKPALAAFEEAKAYLPPQAFIPSAMTRHLLLHPPPRGIEENSENMILRISLKTGMTIWWSIDCLSQTGWSSQLCCPGVQQIWRKPTARSIRASIYDEGRRICVEASCRFRQDRRRADNPDARDTNGCEHAKLAGALAQ